MLGSNRILILAAIALELICIGSFGPLSAGRRPKAYGVSGPVQISSPTEGQSVSGTLHLSVDGDYSTVASVEYRIGNYRISMQTAAPFSFDWNSALAADGNSEIQVVARDYLRNVIFSDTREIVVQNYGNTAESLDGNLGTTWSGTVNVSLHAFDATHFPAYWLLFVDGEQAAIRFTDQAGTHDNSIQQSIDTTQYPNGIHEFHFAFHSNDYGNRNPPGGSQDFRGTITRNVDIENGRAFMDVRADYLHVYTRVGGSVALGCSRLYTNLETDACQSPQYAPVDVTIASVDNSGNLTGLAEGFTDVQLTEGGKSTKIHLWVRNDAGLPHFIDNGQTSTSYAPGKSIFLIAPFLLEPRLLRDDPELLHQARIAGINTLSRGFYQNVNDLNTTFESWRQSFDNTIAPDWSFASANGFRVLAGGDETCRTVGGEGWRSLNWPGAKAAMQYAMQKFAQSGVAVGVDVVDEASGFWGSNPTPVGRIGGAHAMQSIDCSGATCKVNWPDLKTNQFHDVINAGGTFALTGDPLLATPPGQYYTVSNLTSTSFTFTPAIPVNNLFTTENSPDLEYQWFAKKDTCSGAPCSPPVPNSALATFTKWFKTAPETVSISWPPQGIALTYVQSNWMGKGSLSDYASHYWDSVQQRFTYIFGKGVREDTNSMLTAFYNRQPGLQLDRPQIMLQSVSGMNYTKNSPSGSDSYNPPLDELQHVGVVPKAVSAGMMAAAAAGNSGVRLYQFETAYDYQGETQQGPGGGGVQTGGAPFYGEVKNWRSMAYAANVLTKSLQPYILGAPLSSPAYGRNIITAARRGPAGNLLMIVNGWDGARTINVNFQPFASGAGAARYRVSDTFIRTALLPDESGETIQLESGETAIYLFPDQDSAPALDTVSLSFPDAAGNRVAVRMNYLYDDNVRAFGDAVECSNGCSIAVDRSLGDLFYEYAILDSTGAVLTQGPLVPLPADRQLVVRNSSVNRRPQPPGSRR